MISGIEIYTNSNWDNKYFVVSSFQESLSDKSLLHILYLPLHNTLNRCIAIMKCVITT